MNKFQENAEVVQKQERELEALSEQINGLRDRQDALKESIDAKTLADAEAAVKEGEEAQDDFYEAYGFFADEYLKN